MNVMAFHLRRPTEDRDATFFLLLHLGLCLTRARHLTRRHTPGLCLPPAVSHMHTYLRASTCYACHGVAGEWASKRAGKKMSEAGFQPLLLRSCRGKERPQVEHGCLVAL